MKTCECGCGQPVSSLRRRFVHGHNGRLQEANLCSVVTCHKPVHAQGMCGRHRMRIEQHGELYPVTRKSNLELWFWSFVVRPATPDGCWLWTGEIDAGGYGRSVAAALSPTRTKMAHRWVYEQRVGPIPEGLHLDHLCRVRNCVNPEHLEPVTVAENTRRGLHGVLRDACPRGHAATPENTFRKTDGGRRCRRCAMESAREKRVREAAMGMENPQGSPEDFEAAALYRQGWTLPELARRYGKSASGMSTVIRLTGTPLRKPGARPKPLQSKTIRSEHNMAGSGQWGA